MSSAAPDHRAEAVGLCGPFAENALREPDADALYRAQAPRLRDFFRRRLASVEEALDLTHDVMARYLRVAPHVEIATPGAYLRQIAGNLLRDRAERSSTRIAQNSVPLLEGYDQPDEFDQHRVLEGREELRYWAEVLNRLEPLTVTIFLMSRVDGYTYDEIAEQMDVSLRRVKRHMQKAISHIASHRSSLRA